RGDALPLVRLAITLGDPRGIGPEITHAATQRIAAQHDVAFTYFGSEERNVSVERAGQIAGRAIEDAIRAALAREVDGIATAPIDKYALHAGGYDFPGHTEMLAALTRTPVVCMMMAAEKTSIGGPLRVILATTHLPLAGVPAAVTTDLLIEQSMLTNESLKSSWEIEKPR